jgi:hypothetical protein
LGPFSQLTDAELDTLRAEPKTRISSTRLKPKMAFVEQQFELQADADGVRRYRLYRRHHPENSDIFSVGLSVCIGESWLTLCRYNGPYHPHKNHLERNRLVSVCHIHMATQRYIVGAAHPDGFALATDRYTTIDGALGCILLDCRITGILSSGDADPDTMDLDF